MLLYHFSKSEQTSGVKDQIKNIKVGSEVIFRQAFPTQSSSQRRGADDNWFFKHRGWKFGDTKDILIVSFTVQRKPQSQPDMFDFKTLSAS